MAFRTNLVPAIEERTVSGSSVSFNSAFALPLKACKVSFSATQEGSGTPAPDNVRPITGKSSLTITANSVPVFVSLGDTYYGGELDVVSGVLTITRAMKIMNGTESWRASAGIFQTNRAIMGIPTSANFISNVITRVSAIGTTPNVGYAGGTYFNVYMPSFTTLEAFTEYLSDNPMQICYELATPIEFQLSANELSSIIGNNTFSTDTGTLEITFADLQEKSASGSVATFNTALAMPLASCNIAVNAWQEGSGDPSPSNVRAIHGFSEVNATRCGKNLISDYRELVYRYLKDDGEPSGSSVQWDTSPFYPIKENTTYYLSCDNPPTSSQVPRICFYDINKRLISYVNAMANRTIGTPSNAVFIRLSLFHAAYNYQLEAGSTATAYEPYVTPTIYTIQLGQEVYGAEVDVVNGVAHVTHGYREFDGSADENWLTYSTTGFQIYVDNMERGLRLHGKCNFFPTAPQEYDGMSALFGSNNKYFFTLGFVTKYPSINTVELFRSWLSENTIEVVYPLAEPFDIQLTPTQIETLIGNNTIFADTGDIDLTYKDLDIAKRGSFREVFKLPS